MSRWRVVAVISVAVSGIVGVACLERTKDRCGRGLACISAELPYCDCSVVTDNSGFCRAEKTDAFLDCEQYIPPDLAGPASDGSGGMCASSSMCAASTPVCVSNACIACRNEQDDTLCGARSSMTPRCHTDGRCVACRRASQQTDCTMAAKPVCGTDGDCRPCQTHDECESRVCVLEGANAGECVRASDVAYVNNRGVSVSACDALPGTKDGNTPATAFCDVVAGVATSKRYVRVEGSAQPYGPITLSTTREVVIIGPGKGAATRARLFSIGQPAVQVTAAGAVVASVTLDGMDLGGDLVSRTSNGVVCSRTGTASATVIIRNSVVHDSSAVGIQSTDCATTVTSSIIHSNTGGGISLSGTLLPALSYVIENDILYNNGSSGPALRFGGNVQGRARFLTIVDNNRSGGNAAGVDCGGADNDQSIDFSIIWSNDKSTGGSQLTTKCRTRYADADETLAMPAHSDAFNMDPIFVDVNASNYRIQPSSPCKDRIPTVAVTAPPAVDVDLTERPKPAGGNFDVGAHEAQ